MKNKPSLLPLFIIVVGSAAILGLVAGCAKFFEKEETTCNPQMAHCEIHAGPEITIELERDRSADVEVETPKDPETGQEVADFDRMA